MPGPAPKPAAERRHRNKPMANTVLLPAEGRKGPIPKWPLRGRTLQGWADLWRTPQAVMWERQGSELLVARYLVLRNLIQDPDSLEDVNAAAWSELRQLEDRLGLSPMAMLRLRWEVHHSEISEDTDTAAGVATVTRIDGVKDRLKKKQG